MICEKARSEIAKMYKKRNFHCAGYCKSHKMVGNVKKKTQKNAKFNKVKFKKQSIECIHRNVLTREI